MSTPSPATGCSSRIISATNCGGGVDASDLTLTHSRFIHNSAYKGGAFHVWVILRPSSNLLLVENSASLGAAIVQPRPTRPPAFTTPPSLAHPRLPARPSTWVRRRCLDLYNSIVNNYTNAIYLSGVGNPDGGLQPVFQQGPILSWGGAIISGGHSNTGSPPGFVNPAAGNYHLTVQPPMRSGPGTTTA